MSISVPESILASLNQKFLDETPTSEGLVSRSMRGTHGSGPLRRLRESLGSPC